MAAFVEKRPGNWKGDDCSPAKAGATASLVDWTPAFAGTRSGMAKIAFIGLGHMGGGMAPNLAKAGHEVRAFDLVAEAVQHAAKAAARRAASAAEAVKGADVVITMLPAAQARPRRLSRTTSRRTPSQARC